MRGRADASALMLVVRRGLGEDGGGGTGERPVLVYALVPEAELLLEAALSGVMMTRLPLTPPSAKRSTLVLKLPTRSNSDSTPAVRWVLMVEGGLGSR